MVQHIFFPNDSKNLGYFLEYKLYKSIEDLQIFDEILSEDNLKKQWGWSAAGVDQLLVIGDYVIAIQMKWRCTRRRENNGIENFLNSLDYTLSKCGKRLLFGLWVSRLEPFDDNKKKLSSRNIYTISYFDSIDGLVFKTTKMIQDKLSDIK